MISTFLSTPVVMTFAGNDATGGAGIQADIETLASMGCHAAPVITAITVQDTQSVKSYFPIEASTVIAQARTVLEDIPIAAFKIGMLGSVNNAEAIQMVIQDYPDIPVVLDPILVSGNGDPLSDNKIQDALSNLLIPLTTVLTPNSLEAKALATEADTLDACAQKLLDRGCEFVLVTGTHESTPNVNNSLFGNHRLLETFSWERLPFHYHGSGCTLASAIAGLLAQGLEPFTAIHEAQEYTWETLNYGYRIGMGQHIPNRLFWSTTEELGEQGK
ncbi:Hydroxymethylpyrimidine phosphate kinase ThiD [hydrothermal vent metagenome]|uniref:Hydroxymethylpyrimidine phosphate kinase ThiD n=1 Tax=hydrothermal vent metagenome TaxID=652676 RepID=A0A3B0ZE56_9ZZZZ